MLVARLFSPSGFLKKNPFIPYHLLTEKHTQLVRHLGLENSYAKLKASRHKVATLTNHLPMLPVVLIEIMVGYCGLRQDNSEDSDEIYDRLLTLEEFQTL